MKDQKIVTVQSQKVKDQINNEIKGLTFTKNFRSPSAEEWYVFLPSFKEPSSGGAAVKVIIHYNLLGNRDVFINTTIIFDDPLLFVPERYAIVHAVADEIVNRLVGYADTLLSVHAGDNSYQAEYVE